MANDPNQSGEASRELVFEGGVEGGGERVYRVSGEEEYFECKGSFMGFDVVPGRSWSGRYKTFSHYWHEQFLTRSWWPSFHVSFIHDDCKAIALASVLQQYWEAMRQPEEERSTRIGPGRMQGWLQVLDGSTFLAPALPTLLRVDVSEVYPLKSLRYLDFQYTAVPHVQGLLDVLYITALHGIVPARSYGTRWTLEHAQNHRWHPIPKSLKPLSQAPIKSGTRIRVRLLPQNH